MKKRNTMIALSFLFLLSSCTLGFEEINTNPNDKGDIDRLQQLSYILQRGGAQRYDQWRGNLIYCSIWVQHLSGPWETDRYVTANEDWLSAWWNASYQDTGRDLFDMLANTEVGSNIRSVALIYKVFFFQRLTDMYGDVPYSQAGQGANFATPIFDRQEDIYNQFIEELDEAIEGLDEEKDDISSGDLLYQGDIIKWRKFANSLRLRIALRLSKRAESLGSVQAKKAMDEGLMDGIEDSAILQFSGSEVDGTNANGIGEVFQDFGITGHQFRYSDEFVNRIILFDDPREDLMIETYKSDGTVDNSVGSGNHLGRPNGIDPGNDDFVFAQPRRDIMVKYDSPMIYLGYAESEFNRAEAIHRGWIEGDAKQAYENGIKAAMQQLNRYTETEKISESKMNSYVNKPGIAFNASTAIEQINTQKWLALMLDGIEAYANYRRSGFPKLTPGLAKGEGDGDIPRRLRYPIAEKIANFQNYQQAVDRLPNGDVIYERVWWDK